MLAADTKVEMEPNHNELQRHHFHNVWDTGSPHPDTRRLRVDSACKWDFSLGSPPAQKDQSKGNQCSHEHKLKSWDPNSAAAAADVEIQPHSVTLGMVLRPGLPPAVTVSALESFALWLRGTEREAAVCRRENSSCGCFPFPPFLPHNNFTVRNNNKLRDCIHADPRVQFLLISTLQWKDCFLRHIQLAPGPFACLKKQHQLLINDST